MDDLTVGNVQFSRSGRLTRIRCTDGVETVDDYLSFTELRDIAAWCTARADEVDAQ